MKNPGDHDGPTGDEDGPSRPGNGRASGETDAARDDDPGAAETAEHIAAFLDDIAEIRWDRGADPLLEAYRLNSVRAAELLRADGLYLSRPFRIDLRNARWLINRLYEVVEADLPAEPLD